MFVRSAHLRGVDRIKQKIVASQEIVSKKTNFIYFQRHVEY